MNSLADRPDAFQYYNANSERMLNWINWEAAQTSWIYDLGGTN